MIWGLVGPQGRLARELARRVNVRASRLACDPRMMGHPAPTTSSQEASKKEAIKLIKLNHPMK